jgi:hypothetical protein
LWSSENNEFIISPKLRLICSKSHQKSCGLYINAKRYVPDLSR